MAGIHHSSRTTADGLKLAIEKFNEAVAIEPEFALAWGNLGAAYVWAVRFESQYVDPFLIAETFMRAEMPDEAFYWIDRAIVRGSPLTMYLPFWPELDALRDDPRYPALIEKLGLKPTS